MLSLELGMVEDMLFLDDAMAGGWAVPGAVETELGGRQQLLVAQAVSVHPAFQLLNRLHADSLEPLRDDLSGRSLLNAVELDQLLHRRIIEQDAEIGLGVAAE